MGHRLYTEKNIEQTTTPIGPRSAAHMCTTRTEHIDATICEKPMSLRSCAASTKLDKPRVPEPEGPVL
ncbi:unnamed protein product [Bursaphelenchus okinawaensis]|nr:unnamed protein product [Bursaphelenchus okinawaensis]CAD5205322.1 unnamed protein product [Bursaphelenchus okinawaensis]CAD5205325.1 unnamed protein product [Bursaphelenchus okinawaensis]CAD5205331.1 unnamed protein product [Bursaphelenchus okinawaensis]CAD5205334.1 unnamed protein product [Bursaphelenchus okinawaensis]